MLRHFIVHPNKTGAVCASSRALARMITKDMALEQARAVVEIGPGTGAFTGAILERIPEACRFFAVEINAEIVRQFQRRFPDVKIYIESAANLADLAVREEVAKVDAVISGLPWACFPPSLQDDILSAIVAALEPGGRFATFSYVKPPFPKDLRFRRKLRDYFTHVEKTPVVWKNIPPAFVYRCWN